MDRRGQKTGAGFYDYDDKRQARPSPVVEKIIRDFAASKGITPRVVSEQEILERCIYPMINEGAKILEEGIAIRASDIDVVWVNGYGWPVYRGGPMFGTATASGSIKCWRRCRTSRRGSGMTSSLRSCWWIWWRRGSRSRTCSAGGRVAAN